MYIVIVGGGTFGEPLAKKSIKAGHDVVVVEQDEGRAEELAKQIDAMIIEGDASEPEIIDDAGIDRCDMLITTVRDDAVNVLVSLLSQEYDISKVVSVSTTPKYEDVLNRIGVDKVVRPKDLVSDEIMRYISHPDMEGFLQIDDTTQVGVFQVSEDSKAVGREVSDIRKTKLPPDILLVSISRDDETIIPRGDSVVEAGDDIAILFKDGKTEDIESVLSP